MSGWSQETYIEAYRFAAEAHKGQCFKGTDLPYIVHVNLVCMEIMAALVVEKERDGDLAIQCALLHDVLEDTQTSFEDLQRSFGQQVADGVKALSKDESIHETHRLVDSLSRIREQPHEVWMVKLADRITNLQPPPPKWTKEKINDYLAGARQIHATLKDASPTLAARLEKKITNYGIFIK